MMRKNLILTGIILITGALLGFQSLPIDSYLSDNPSSLDFFPTPEPFNPSPAPPSLASIDSLNNLELKDVLGVQVIWAGSIASGGANIKNNGGEFVNIGIEWRSLAPSETTLVADYQWSSFDSALSTASSLGLQIAVVLGGNPTWAADFDRGPINKVPITRFQEYVQAVVSRYSAAPYNVKFWSIYNEPDVGSSEISTFGSNPSDYVQTLQLAYQTIKAIDSDAVVLLGGLAHDGFTEEGGPFIRSFLDDILKLGAGAYFDAMNFHYYPAYDWRWTGLTGLPALMGKAQELRGIMAANDVDKPMVCTELGLSSSATFGESDESQSRAVVKFFSRAIAADLPIAIWYNMNDYASVPSDVFAFHGLLDVSFVPKLSLSALETLASYLDGRIYIRSMSSTEWGASQMEGYIYRHVQNSVDTAVVWSADGSLQVITLPSGVGAVDDKFGNPISFGSTLQIDENPVFITYSISGIFLPLTMK